jgi:hypothetical protein
MVKVTNPGQKNLIGAKDPASIRDDLCLPTRATNHVRDRGKISDPVVDDPDH